MNVNRQLIEACRRDDRKAQYELYRQCFNVLMGVCVRYRKQESDALAAVNAGFLKILTSLDKYSAGVPFEAWIRRIMINTLIDEFRKNRKVRELFEYRDFTEEHHSYDLLEHNETEKVFDTEQLTEMIRQLPTVSRKVFNLFAIDGYSHNEISELLNMSVGTSKWHLSFARKKLRELLKKALKASKVI